MTKLEPGSTWRHNQSGRLVELVQQVEMVRYSNQGGGFTQTVPLDEFLANYYPSRISAKYEAGEFQLNQYDGEPTYPGFCTEQRWNGWHMPVFDLQTALRILGQAEVVQLVMDDEGLLYRLPQSEDLMRAPPILVNGTKCYGVGAGEWTWSRVIAEPADTSASDD